MTGFETELDGLVELRCFLKSDLTSVLAYFRVRENGFLLKGYFCSVARVASYFRDFFLPRGIINSRVVVSELNFRETCLFLSLRLAVFPFSAVARVRRLRRFIMPCLQRACICFSFVFRFC